MLRALVLALVVSASSANAHAKLTNSVPANGAIITIAPSMVSMTFNKPIRLASIVVTTPQGASVALDLTSSASFEVQHDLPSSLSGQGNYSLLWRGFSKDGHLLSGTIEFEVR